MNTVWKKTSTYKKIYMCITQICYFDTWMIGQDKIRTKFLVEKMKVVSWVGINETSRTLQLYVNNIEKTLERSVCAYGICSFQNS